MGVNITRTTSELGTQTALNQTINFGAAINAFKLYNSGTNGGNYGAADNLYFNNLSVSAVPEPGTIISFLSGSSLLGAMMFIRRRRA